MSFLFTSLNSLKVLRTVLQILSNKFLPFSKTKSYRQECCICLSAYENGTELRELPCNHHFHCNCIDKWLHMNATCPLCKFNILKPNSSSSEEVWQSSLRATNHRHKTQHRSKEREREREKDIMFWLLMASERKDHVWKCSCRYFILKLASSVVWLMYLCTYPYPYVL